MAAASIANQPTVSMLIRDQLEIIEADIAEQKKKDAAKAERRAAANAERDLGPVKIEIEIEIDDRLTEGQMVSLAAADQQIGAGSMKQRAAARATVRRIEQLRREMVLRQEVAIGLEERAALEARRGVEVVLVGQAHVRFPRVGGQRDGLLALLKANKLTAFETMAGIAYRGLWSGIEASLRSSVTEIVSTSGRRETMFAALAAAEEQRETLAVIDQMVLDLDDEGEALHLIHWVVRDGFAIRSLADGGKQYDRQARVVSRMLREIGVRLDI